MRLGGPVFERYEDPRAWIAALREQGYRACYCPLEPTADDAVVRAFAAAARTADIVIAEVGAWSNPLSPDPAKRAHDLRWCQDSLALAERLGARCCVNISGSRGEKWDGPCPLDLTAETFDMIVESVRAIVDAVKPTRTCYTLETMPWMYPDSADSYLRLLRAVDRKAFAVHFDPVNLINSPERCFRNGLLIQDFIAKLGPHIRSCHLKDTRLDTRLTVHLDEVRPGTGALDYRGLLRALADLPDDVPAMLEHLPKEEYAPAAAYLREVACELGIPL